MIRCDAGKRRGVHFDTADQFVRIAEDAVEGEKRKLRGEAGQRARGRPDPIAEMVQGGAPSDAPLVEIAEQDRRPVLTSINRLDNRLGLLAARPPEEPEMSGDD